jgi:hypothetical protein
VQTLPPLGGVNVGGNKYNNALPYDNRFETGSIDQTYSTAKARATVLPSPRWRKISACRARALVCNVALSRADNQGGPGSWHTPVRNDLVAPQDRSLLALAGASRGASTAAYTSIGVLEKRFAGELTGAAWLRRLKEIIPSRGISLIGDTDFTRRIRVATTAVLRIEQV